MTPDDDPVNTAVLSDSSCQLVVENCVLCGETHTPGPSHGGDVDA